MNINRVKNTSNCLKNILSWAIVCKGIKLSSANRKEYKKRKISILIWKRYCYNYFNIIPGRRVVRLQKVNTF